MNKIFVRNSCKTYQAIAGSGASPGAGSSDGKNQQKNAGKKDEGEDFRAILAKKLKAA